MRIIGIYVVTWVILFTAMTSAQENGSFSAQKLCSVTMDEIASKHVANTACFVGVNALGLAIESDMLGENALEIEDIGANLVGSGLGAITIEWKF